MPLHMGRVLAMQDEPSTSSVTEYRESFLSPRRADYNPQVALPKISSGRPPSNRAFLSSDFEPDTTLKSSEYRLCFENYHPKRPYCFHAKPSHVFDYVLKPIERRAPSRLSANKDTEYQDRYLNYRSFIPMQELLPPHRTSKSNAQSDTQNKKEYMTRSHYFHQLIQDNEKFTGGQRIVGTSEHRNAFQWPYNYPPVQQRTPFVPPQQQQVEVPPPPTVYQPYSTPKNIYEPLPPITRTIIKATN